eukprot:5287964-Amphidinium_carterae.1
MAKSPVVNSGSKSWQNIKKKVLKFARKEYPERAVDWRMLGRWGMPANAVALQLVAQSLRTVVCLDWQGDGYCFGIEHEERPEVWLRLYDHHFQPAHPVSGPVQPMVNGGELDLSQLVCACPTADLEGCYGGAQTTVGALCMWNLSKEKQKRACEPTQGEMKCAQHNSWSGKNQTKTCRTPQGAAPAVKDPEEGKRGGRRIRKEEKGHTSRLIKESDDHKCYPLCVESDDGSLSGSRGEMDKDRREADVDHSFVLVDCFGGMKRKRRQSQKGDDPPPAGRVSEEEASDDPPAGRVREEEVCREWRGGERRGRRTRRAQRTPKLRGDSGATSSGGNAEGGSVADRECGEQTEFFPQARQKGGCGRDGCGARRHEMISRESPGSVQPQRLLLSRTFEPAGDPFEGLSSVTFDCMESQQQACSSEGGVVHLSGKGKSQDDSSSGRMEVALSPTLPWPSEQSSGDSSGTHDSEEQPCCNCHVVVGSVRQCAFARCSGYTCDGCATVIRCEYGDIGVGPCCSHKLLADSPMVIHPTQSDEPAQQILVTVPVVVHERWVWVTAGQHEPTSKVVSEVASCLCVDSGTWMITGRRWEDNDLVEHFGVCKRKSHSLVWRATAVPARSFSERVMVEVPGNIPLPVYVPKPLQWSVFRKCVARHLAVAPEWVEVTQLSKSNVQVRLTEAFPVAPRTSMGKLWELVRSLDLHVVKRKGIGKVMAMNAGLRATRARGLTKQTWRQSAVVRQINECVLAMMPSVRYAAFAVLVHGAVRVHKDGMNKKGELSYTVADKSCTMWMSDKCGDSQILFEGQQVRGREHQIAWKWCAFDPLKPHAIVTGHNVTTLVLYTPGRAPANQAMSDALRHVGFPVRSHETHTGAGALRNMWGGGSRRAKSAPKQQGGGELPETAQT